MRWAGKVAPACFTLVWNVYSFTRPCLSHFHPVVCRDCVLSEPQPMKTNKHSFSVKAGSKGWKGAQCETEKTILSRKFSSEFLFYLVSCFVLYIPLHLSPLFTSSSLRSAGRRYVTVKIFWPGAEKTAMRQTIGGQLIDKTIKFQAIY